MEPNVSLPYSQAPATCPYPKPDQPSSSFPLRFLNIILLLFSHLRLGLPSGLFPTFPHPSPRCTSPLYSNIKFYENPSSGSQVVPCGQTDGDGHNEAKPPLQFCNFVKSLKMKLLCSWKINKAITPFSFVLNFHQQHLKINECDLCWYTSTPCYIR